MADGSTAAAVATTLGAAAAADALERRERHQEAVALENPTTSHGIGRPWPISIRAGARVGVTPWTSVFMSQPAPGPHFGAGY